MSLVMHAFYQLLSLFQWDISARLGNWSWYVVYQMQIEHVVISPFIVLNKTCTKIMMEIYFLHNVGMKQVLDQKAAILVLKPMRVK